MIRKRNRYCWTIFRETVLVYLNIKNPNAKKNISELQLLPISRNGCLFFGEQGTRQVQMKSRKKEETIEFKNRSRTDLNAVQTFTTNNFLKVFVKNLF